MTARAGAAEPWKERWPEDGLESVSLCPVCGDARRDILHEGLVDKVFRVAPGVWHLWGCKGCGTAYLDPRPTPESIHRAYAGYYTHVAPQKKPDYASLTPLRKARRQLVNGYTNRRFGTTAFPASALGPLILPLLPRARRKLACEYRHLPKPERPGATFLEVGFGSAAFLETAASCGWKVKGVDPDAVVVAAAREKDFDVQQGGIDVIASEEGSYDVIMMNHVIEHLHEPLQALQRSAHLLRPGGILYIETPSLDSLGYKHFGPYWRDLDPPRHLVLFNENSLRSALNTHGFHRIRRVPRANPIVPISLASVAARDNRSITSRSSLPGRERLFAGIARLFQSVRPSLREYISFVAEKTC